MTSDETPSQLLRLRLLDAMLQIAPSQGWSESALRSAAGVAGLGEGECALAAPRGAIDVIDAFAERADDAMSAALDGMELGAMRIREKVRAGVWSRLLALEPHRQAIARSLVVLALPQHTSDGARIGWRTADRLWRALADTSTDENYYSKRAILAGVHAATLARWLADDSPDRAAASAFLDARIENVMQFEKLKARLRQAPALGEALLGTLASFRYR